tara:strand:- start:549 stop:1220 length:672 start_codon:yes stop_codon:yes gene_type:complete
MNRLKIVFITLIASAIMVLPSTAKEVRVGIAAGMTAIQAEGSETLKSSGRVQKSEAAAMAVIPSAFVELAADNGFGLGVEHVPGSADINSATRSRVLDNGNGDTGTNKASAEIDGLTSVYLMKTFESGFFVKAGMTSTTVNTKEVLATGSKYNNADIDGTVLGLGFTNQSDNGMFFRVSGEYTDYDSISLTSTTAADATTTTKNKIKADVDTLAMKISIGKAF